MITVRVQDANELLVGSPVHMMGLEVGYVTRLKVRPQGVDVTIRTNPDALPIPPGTTFTVLFSGLGGSERIEASLPAMIPEDTGQWEDKSPSNHYNVGETIRLKQLLDSNVEVTQALRKGAENLAGFFGPKASIATLQHNIRHVEQVSDGMIQTIGHGNAHISKVMANFHTSANRPLSQSEALRAKLEDARRITDPNNLGPRVKKALLSVRHAEQRIVPGLWQPASVQIPSSLSAANWQILRQCSENNLLAWIDFQTRLQAALSHTEDVLCQYPPASVLDKTRYQLQGIRNKLQGWNARLLN